jgi:hypothetical protein
MRPPMTHRRPTAEPAALLAKLWRSSLRPPSARPIMAASKNSQPRSSPCPSVPSCSPAWSRSHSA